MEEAEAAAATMAEEDYGKKKEKEPSRILEFYSGIGGMRYSVMRAGIDAVVVEAFDINDTANDVYQHNFAHRPSQGNIQTLTSTELDKFGADAWLMSPPCQPYTRQGLQKHSADARAFSFIKIIELVPHMLHPPSLLFVENVVGFETSDTHMLLMKILAENKFVTQEFILSPLQFGVPYSRPRYFCLAKREPLSFKKLFFNGQLLRTTIPFLKRENIDSEEKSYQSRDECKPIRVFLRTRNSSTHLLKNGEADAALEPISGSALLQCDNIDIYSHKHSAVEKAANVTIVDNTEDNNINSSLVDNYSVPFSLIERWGSAMDIVFPDSKRCCCFTKSYYRYVKGTGSLLATIQPTDQSNFSSLKELGLRYFTPREVANLHSFPENFNFPEHIGLRQRYALLGNSLSVAVVAPLLKYLFTGGEHGS